MMVSRTVLSLLTSLLAVALGLVAALNDEVPAVVVPFYAADALLSLPDSPAGGDPAIPAGGIEAELEAIVEEFQGDQDAFGVLFARFDGDSAAVHVAGDIARGTCCALARFPRSS